jgi:hypothetical protein
MELRRGEERRDQLAEGYPQWQVQEEQGPRGRILRIACLQSVGLLLKLFGQVRLEVDQIC